MRKSKVSLVVLSLLLAAFAVYASMLVPAADKAREKAKAPEKSPVIDETPEGNWDLVRLDFIHFAKPEKPGKPGGEPKPPSCFGTLGVQWKVLPVAYVVNPTTPDELPEDVLLDTVSASAETWDAATGAELFDDTFLVDYTAECGVQDYENVIAFSDYPDPNVIGVCSIWYTRRGRQIVEFDICLNTKFLWGDGSVNPLVMDVANIVTHELGHSVGMDDIYDDACADVTMYGYSQEGETHKRTLEPPDIAGLQSMYGP
ncbi:MAG: hypothetical protein JXR37_24090 [Kiritimatiellae bacterium]|nr:hypothetical protein [Kiritimatiellia bacterium]